MTYEQLALDIGETVLYGKIKKKIKSEQNLGFAISSIGTIPLTSKRSGYTHSFTCNLSSSSSQVTTLCGNPTVKCFSS